MPILRVDNKALIRLADKLEKTHKNALPNAVRNTLNTAAFNVKQQTMPRRAAAVFENRSPNFFKYNSSVDMARGYNVGSMRSTVGFTSYKLSHNTKSVQELEQQEYGGKISHRQFVPLEESREGGSVSNPVRSQNRLKNLRGRSRGNLKNIIDSSYGKGSKQARFVRAAFKAGQGGLVMGNQSKKIVYRVEVARRLMRRNLELKVRKLYSFQPNRAVSIHQTGFMRGATNDSAKNLTNFFIKQAQREFNRVFK